MENHAAANQPPSSDEDTAEHMMSTSELLALMAQVYFPEESITEECTAIPEHIPQDTLTQEEQVVSTEDQRLDNQENTPLPAALPGWLWADLTYEEAGLLPFPPLAPSSLAGVEQIRKPSSSVGKYTWLASLLLPIFLFMGLIGILVVPRFTLSREKNNRNITQQLPLLCENRNDAPQFISGFTVESSPTFTENTPQKHLSFTYILASEDDYPTALAWACGFTGREGRDALAEIQRLNPQINWKKQKTFHQGEKFKTPCELNAELVKKARQNIYRYHKLRRLKHEAPDRVATKNLR